MRMKKIWISGILVLMGVVLAACGQGGSETLNVLNWGDYINTDLLERFEAETGITVVYDEVGSNEEMDVRIQLGTTQYDLMVPSDYMMDKWVQEGQIQPLDFDLLPNYDAAQLMDGVVDLIDGERFYEYMVPYFYGTIGLMYNTNVEGLEAAIQAQGFGVLFDQDSPYAIGMYDSPRDALGAALMHLGYSPNTEDASHLQMAETLLRFANITVYGEDDLNNRVIEGNLDVALVYSGDYFDELYAHEAEGLDVNFAYIAPARTNVWVDGFVIPAGANNVDAAHAFINFMVDPDNALENADYVGYTPVFTDTFEAILNDFELDASIFNPIPSGQTRYIYQFISSAHNEALLEAFNRAKSN